MGIRKCCSLILSLALLAWLPGCSADSRQSPLESEEPAVYDTAEKSDGVQKPWDDGPEAEPDASVEQGVSEELEVEQGTHRAGSAAEAAETAPTPADAADAGDNGASANSDPLQEEGQVNTMYLQIGNRTLTATLVENTSTAALKELLAEGPVTIGMKDYGGMEKVGSIGASLPTNDEQMTTGPGDLILYQGNSFVIYYAANTWSLTRLGRIDGVSPEELKAVLGGGDMTVTLSLPQQ